MKMQNCSFTFFYTILLDEKITSKSHVLNFNHDIKKLKNLLGKTHT